MGKSGVTSTPRGLRGWYVQGSVYHLQSTLPPSFKATGAVVTEKWAGTGFGECGAAVDRADGTGAKQYLSSGKVGWP